jgi:hypothetical protein
MGEIVPELFQSIDTVINNPKSAPGDKIILDVLPNGSFKIETNNPEANRKFNEKFSNQINNALDSYAVANGLSREKAAGEFYNKYFGDLLQGDPDLDTLQGATSSSPALSEPTLPTPSVEPPVANPSALQRVIPDGEALPPTILDRNLDSVEKKFPQWENPTIDNIKEEAATAWEKVNRDFRSGKITSEQRLEEASRINNQMKQRIQDFIKRIIFDRCESCKAHSSNSVDFDVAMHDCVLDRDVENGCWICFLPAIVVNAIIMIKQAKSERYWIKKHCAKCEDLRGCKKDVFECMS